MVSYHTILEQLESFYPNDKEKFCIFYSSSVSDYCTVLYKQPQPTRNLNGVMHNLVKTITSQEIRDVLTKTSGIYHALEMVYPKSEYDSIKNGTCVRNHTLKDSEIRCCDMIVSSHQVICHCCKKPVRRLDTHRLHNIQDIQDIQSHSLSDIMTQFKKSVNALEHNNRRKKNPLLSPITMGAGLVSGLLLGDMMMSDIAMNDTITSTNDIQQLNMSPIY